jgi:hypothetical protein
VIPVDVKALDEQELVLNGDTSRVLEFLSRELDPLVECWLDLVRSSDVVRLAKSGDELEALLEELQLLARHGAGMGAPSRCRMRDARR